LFNRYVNEAQVRAAKWIFRTVEKSAHFLFDDIAKELSIDSFQITDLDRIEQVIKHFTVETFRRINPISSSISSQNYVLYLDGS
jgi:hypothetical protein